MKENLINIKDACLDAAHEIIAEKGLDQLSLREVSRRLNISHQAPYKHFPSKDHLLAEVLSRCFRNFAYALENREPREKPIDSLNSMGVAYLKFALQKPLEYKLMFGTTWPESAKNADMIKNSLKAFNLLKTALLEIYEPEPNLEKRAELDAIYIWSVMHGYAMILQSNAMSHMELEETTLHEAAQHIFKMIRKGLV